MRALVALLVLSLSGCSFLDSVASGASMSPTYDPSKIYLGSDTRMIRVRDADRYACAEQPMFCERFGSLMECRCAE
jgi:hypothetical protein